MKGLRTSGQGGRRRRPRKGGFPSAKTVVFLVVVIAAVAAIGYSIGSRPSSPSDADGVSAWVGRQAPTFTLPEVNGSTFRLSDYLGRGNVLLFFHEGLSCPPCLQQTVDLDKDYESFRGLNTTIVAITTDSQSSLGQWVKLNGVTHLLVLSDRNQSVDRLYNTLGYNVSMMPGTSPGHTFILVDPSGTIKWRADYGPGRMYVQDSEVVSSVTKALA